MERMRSFIAIELPPEIKLELARLQQALKEDGQPRIKWVNPQGIHLTLKFLGNIDPAVVGGITGAMTDAASTISPFTLDLRQPGAFPNLERVQVVWVGLGGELEVLKKLQQSLESKLAKLGFPPEKRPFKPHLTLARLGDEATTQQRRRLGELISGTKFETNQEIKADAINLMRSQLTATGAVYSRIGSAALSR